MTPVLAPDVQLPNAPAPLPIGHVVWPGRPLIVETNARNVSVTVLTGHAEMAPIDAYGAITGTELELAPGTPQSLAGSSRWRISHDGDSGSAAPLAFT